MILQAQQWPFNVMCTKKPHILNTNRGRKRLLAEPIVISPESPRTAWAE